MRQRPRKSANVATDARKKLVELEHAEERDVGDEAEDDERAPGLRSGRPSDRLADRPIGDGHAEQEREEPRVPARVKDVARDRGGKYSAPYATSGATN